MVMYLRMASLEDQHQRHTTWAVVPVSHQKLQVDVPFFTGAVTGNAQICRNSYFKCRHKRYLRHER